MKVLVTGAAGYIGSTLVRHLLRDGCRVLGVDNLLFGGMSLLGVLDHPNFEFRAADIVNDAATLAEWIDEETAIVHLAAIVGDPASKKAPEETRRTNLVGTERMLALALERKARKFVFVSTCSNYGKVAEGCLATEDEDLSPLSLYAETKVAMERKLRDEIGDRLDWTILRFATVYGLSPRPRFDLTVNDFTWHAIRDRKLVVFLPHTNRPYVHVVDASRAVMRVLDGGEAARGQVFNVGATDENYRKIEIVDEVRKIVGEFEVELVDRGADPRDYRVSFEKIRSRLGYEVTRRVPDGVREIAEAVKSRVIPDPESPFFANA